MKRLRETEARAVLKQELAGVGWEAESAFTVAEGARPSTETLDWWHANTPVNESSTTSRNLAYLRAYVRIAGGERLLAGGLLLDRRRLWMDRSVISRLERDGFLLFDPAARPAGFTLTEQGREWISAGGWSPTQDG